MLKSSWGLPPTVIGRYGSIASIDGIVKNGDNGGMREGVKDMRSRSVPSDQQTLSPEEPQGQEDRSPR